MDGRTDRQTDTMELIVAFHTSASMHVNFSLLKVTLCSLAEVYCNCRGIRCLHPSVSHTRRWQGSSEIPVRFYKAVGHHIANKSSLHSHCLENIHSCRKYLDELFVLMICSVDIVSSGWFVQTTVIYLQSWFGGPDI